MEFSKKHLLILYQEVEMMLFYDLPNERWNGSSLSFF